MSGSTIGGIAGALVGSFFGPVGMKWGWMIGSLVGGYVDPQKIEGPRLKDATRQTSQDGIPIPFGYGSFPTTGNLIWTDRLVETKSTKRQGKGGPKVTEYTYTRSYAVGVCEGEIAGYLIVKRNGKIVYDTRTNAELTAAGYTSAQIAESRAAQAKWQEVATLYYGDEAQTPAATMVAVEGAGNVPAYRGLAYIVVTDEDLTAERGAVPQYEFVVSVCGTRSEEQELPFRWIVNGTGEPNNMAVSLSPSSFTETKSPGVGAVAVAVTVGDRIILDGGYSDDFGATWGALSNWPSFVIDGFVTSAGRLLLVTTSTKRVYYSDDGGDTFAWVDVSAFSGTPTGICGDDGAVIVYTANDNMLSTDGGETFGSIRTNATSFGRASIEALGYGDGLFVSAGGGASALGFGWSDNNGASGTAGESFPGTIASQACRVLYAAGIGWVSQHRTNSETQAIHYSANGKTGWVEATHPGIRCDDSNRSRLAAYAGTIIAVGEIDANFAVLYTTSGSVWIEAAIGGTVNTADAAYSATVLRSGDYTGTELPDAPGHYVDEDGVVNGPAGTVVDRCTPELGTDIIADLCARREVTDIDVSELTDLVDGFKVATETDPATAIDSTRAAYFYDASEYDGVIHFPKRGGSPAFALTMDDLAARDGDPIEWERVQEAELLRKVTVAYLDPATTYTQTTQKWERRTGTVEAKGEGSVEIPVVGTKDFAAQVAEMRGKAAWAETDKCRFSLPYKWAKLTPADVGTLTDALGKVHRIRILSIEDDSGYRHVEAVREQTNTYVSTAVGSSGPNPTYPGSGLAGPTVAAIMNLPVLRDEDDKAGLYIAAAGMLPGWQGALIQMARDGATFENGPIIAANATMGELTATLATASRYGQDNTNTLSVRLLPTSGDLSSTTYDGLIESEANSAAILYADGTAEIVQFQTATETAPGEYDLTGLMRGRQDTAIASHASGARFVLLDDAIRFAAIKASDVGKTLTFRPVSVGSSPGSNATQTITMTTIQSLREWSPYSVTVESDGLYVGEGEGEGYCVSWIGRARLGSSLLPIHSQWFAGYRVTFTSDGVNYEVDTTDQSYCADAAELTTAFGSYGQPTVTVRALSRIATNDDDFSSPPSAPSTSPPATTPNGTPGSTTTGPNGGFADDAPHPIPTPTVLGSDLVGTPGQFTSAADLAQFTDVNGGALVGWTIESGRARYQGVAAQNAYAYYRPANLRMPSLPMPRYTVTITADVQTANGALATIGFGAGTGTSTPTAYPVSTPVSYSLTFGRQVAGVTGRGLYVIPIVTPVLGVLSESGGVVTAWFDNITVEVVEETEAVTAFVPANIDFPADDLTGWVTFAGSYTESFASGEMTASGTGSSPYVRYYINEDPITLADAVGKYIHVEAEVWSNDPTVEAGVAKNGVALGVAIKSGSSYIYAPYAYVFHRGDWTAREWWQRITGISGGVTYHVMFAVRGAPTYQQKIRNITVEVCPCA